MTFLDAAYEVLKRAGQPLHYVEIANHALASGLLDTRGQTPEATMGSRLYVDTKRPGSRFRRVSRGVFALAEAQPGDIGQRIESLNRKTRADLRKRLLGMPPDRFEALISELLIAIGFDEATVEVTRHSGDGGIDVRGVLRAGGVTQVNAAVQVKRWKRNIQAPTVRDLRGSLTVHEQGILITTSDFSTGARKEAEEAGKTRISLVDGERLLELLIQHGIGVTQEQHTLLSLDEEWWGELTRGALAMPEWNTVRRREQARWLRAGSRATAGPSGATAIPRRANGGRLMSCGAKAEILPKMPAGPPNGGRRMTKTCLGRSSFVLRPALSRSRTKHDHPI
jgi:restriction system protein